MGIFLKDINLKGKTALITGATKGLGRGAAIAIAEAGGNVIAIGRNQKELDTLRKEIKKFKVNYVPFSCDVNDYNLLKSFITKLKKLDILVNNAGTNIPEPFLNVKKSSMETLLNVNTKAVFNVAQLWANQIIKLKRKSGSIINISSVVSSIIGAPNRCIYGTTKAAVIGLTKSVAVDYVKQGIRCNAICPGTVDTPSLHSRLKDTGDYEKAKQDFISRQPLGRIGKAEEIASLALYFSSDESSFVTGQTHVIDGGWSVGWNI